MPRIVAESASRNVDSTHAVEVPVFDVVDVGVPHLGFRAQGDGFLGREQAKEGAQGDFGGVGQVAVGEDTPARQRAAVAIGCRPPPSPSAPTPCRSA
jgi:hypothetical protein